MSQSVEKIKINNRTKDNEVLKNAREQDKERHTDNAKTNASNLIFLK